MARNVGGVHDIVYNLNILSLKLNFAFTIDDTKIKLKFSPFCYYFILQITQKTFKSVWAQFKQQGQSSSWIHHLWFTV